MTPTTRKQLRSLFINSSISGIVTAIFMYWFYYQGWESIAAGLCIGFFIYVAISVYDVYINRRYRREIAFVGDVLNTTSRIVGECKNMGQPLLVSEEVVAKMPESAPFVLFDVGDVKLRGKVKEMKLYGVSFEE